MSLIMILFGGFLGAISRYFVQIFFNKILPKVTIPLSILMINLIGSFCLGVIILKEFDSSKELFWMTGFLGAFTTFSTFSMESVFLIENYGIFKAFVYIAVSIIGCIFLFFIGNVVAMSL